jgi:phosphoenolpyruvate-protein kinase (PTS system EI component)
VYRTVLKAMQPYMVVIRTLDIGADKPLPYLPAPTERNPFLGLRGIRYTLAHPELFRAQLRALLRASTAGQLAIMFPMVSEVQQIERARALLAEVQAEVGGGAEIGIMIEIPAAALIADRLAAHVSFFSVGTNDLTQYTLAVDRTNEHVSDLVSALHPAVLEVLDRTVAAAHAQQKWVGICGEMAADPIAIPLLVGLGVDELSMSPSAILSAKERIRNLSFERCQALAQQALQCASAAAVEQLVQQHVPPV